MSGLDLLPLQDWCLFASSRGRFFARPSIYFPVDHKPRDATFWANASQRLMEMLKVLFWAQGVLPRWGSQ